MKFIEATKDDLGFLFELRNDKESVKYSKRGYLELEELEKDYFDNSQKKVFIAYEGNDAIGYLIFEKLEEKVFEISIAISPNHRGKGFGKLIVKEGTLFGITDLGAKRIVARVFSNNKLSLKIFKENFYMIIDDKIEPWILVFDATKNKNVK
jgi:RimJ/RimL family protein N-acetyltransferase